MHYYYVIDSINCDFQKLEDFKTELKLNSNSEIFPDRIIMPISKFLLNSTTYIIAITKDIDDLIILKQDDFIKKVFISTFRCESVHI